MCEYKPEERSVYLAKALVSDAWLNRRFGGCRKKGCDQPAAFSLFRVAAKIFTFPSTYCPEHARAAAKGAELVTTADRLAEIAAELSRNKDANFARQVDAQHTREKEELAANGKILRLSGIKGRMFELSDGSLVCELRNGVKIVPCCWLEGGRLIENLIRGRASTGHSDNCAPLRT